jgi:hypothetical protein
MLDLSSIMLKRLCNSNHHKENVHGLLELHHPAFIRGNHLVVRSVQRRGLPRGEGLLDGHLRLLLLLLRLHRLSAEPPPAQARVAHIQADTGARNRIESHRRRGRAGALTMRRRCRGAGRGRGGRGARGIGEVPARASAPRWGWRRASTGGGWWWRLPPPCRWVLRVRDFVGVCGVEMRRELRGKGEARERKETPGEHKWSGAVAVCSRCRPLFARLVVGTRNLDAPGAPPARNRRIGQRRC